MYNYQKYGCLSCFILNIIVLKGQGSMRNAVKTIGGLIDKSSVSIISSVDRDGYPNTKAMLPPRIREGIKFFYFSTNASSMRVKQYMKNPKACIYFFDKKYLRGVMLKGTMEVLQDTKSKDMVWRDGDEIYYPKGITDPNYCVLKFKAESVRIYCDLKSEDFQVT